MSGITNIILDTPSEELEKILSPFIREQFPQFVRSDYNKLVLFIKAYYEWLEKSGNASYVLMNLQEAADIDSNLEEFYSHFKAMYLDGFPETFAVDETGKTPNKKTLLKKIREFYGNKGTESAYRFLFNVLYDSDLEIYYPSTDILKASDGRWIEPISIKTTSTNGTALFGAKGGNAYQYRGADFAASAFVNSVVQYTFNGLPITEFFLTEISGDFTPDQQVVFVNGNLELSETAYSVLGDFYVETPGSGYRIGDTVTLFDQNGKGFAAKVQQTGFAGGVKKIEIVNSGVNYFASPEGVCADSFLLTIFSDSGQQTAKVYGTRSALTRYPGYFLGNRGKVSSNKKIQDGHYYQDFSYELKAAVSLDTYFGVLKSVIHPAGMKMFGSVLVKKTISNNITSSTQATYYETPIIGKYTPYKTTTSLDLRDNGVVSSGYWLGATGDLYPLGYNPYIGSTTEVGPNGTTTSLGTVFVGSSLGYTWCYVPEDGITSHNPIGAPLGSTASWYANKETAWTPAGMRGLVLWLKPENIGLCGSVANGATVDVWTDASPQQNHALPPTWGRFNGMASVGAGITIDKLRPRLFAASIAGPTGVCFNGGVLYSPSTVWSGISLAKGICLGTTYGAGTTAEKIQTAQHLYLKNGITLSAEADIFMVFRSTSDDWKRGVGLVSSNGSLSGISGSDAVIYHRSYNQIDRDTAKQTSEYYLITPTGRLMYPTTLPTGLVGFRPGAGQQSNQQNSISYDPHVSGACMGTVIGEWSRGADGVVESFVNGDKSLNKSRSTGRVITSSVYPNSEDYLVRNGLILFFDGKSILSRGEISDAYSSNLIYRYGSQWVYGNPETNYSLGKMSNWSPNRSIAGQENTILYDRDPWGAANLVWQAKPTDVNGANADGGWNGPVVEVDSSKTYRFSFWLNRKIWGSGQGVNNQYSGRYYVGAYAYDSSLINTGLVRRNDNTQSNNQYFTSSYPTYPFVNMLPENTWQLVCHHIHPAGSGAGADHPDSGYYLRSTGIAGKRTYGSDLVWTQGTSRAQFRTYLFAATTTEPVQQWVYPRVDVVDGSEPSVQDLLDNKPNTWVDISATGLTAAFSGGSPYSSNDGGVLSFYGGNYVEWKTPVLSVYDESSSAPNKRVNRFTAELWIKPTGTYTSTLFATDSNGSLNMLEYDGVNQRAAIWVAALSSQRTYNVTTTNSVPLNKWTQIVLQIENNTVTVYVNGKQNIQYSTTYGYIAPWDATGTDPRTGVSYLGQRPTANYFLIDAINSYPSGPDLLFRGQISNIRLYNRILNSDEILQNYNVLRNRVGL